MLRQAGFLLSIVLLPTVATAATKPAATSCAAAEDAEARAACWLGLADTYSDRLRVVDAGVDDHPDAALVALARIQGDGSRAHLGDRAWHAELRARALQRLGRSDEAAAAWERSLTIYDGTDRLNWVEPREWSVALDVGDGRLVRVARGLAAAGRDERAREIAARAIALGDRGEAVGVWQAAGGEDLPVAGATDLEAPPWRAMLPIIDLPMFGGKTFSFESARGNVVIVDFWASWCAPCVKELPFLDALYREYHEEGLEVVAVNYQEPPDAAMAFVQSMTLTLPVAMATQEADRFFEVEAMPTVVIADRDGGIRARWEGYEDDVRVQMRDLVVELLAEEKARAPSLGQIYEGAGVLEVEWVRAAREPVLGIGLVDVAGGERRIAAVLNRSIDLFDVSGHVAERVAVPPGVGRVFSTHLADAPLVVSYRPGGRQVLSFRGDGDEMAWFDSPAPVFAAAVVPDEEEAPFLLATLDGVFATSRDGKVRRPVEGFGPASDVAWLGSEGWVLETSGRLQRLGSNGRRRGKARTLDGAWNLLQTADGKHGFGVSGFGVTSAAVGSFLGGDGRQAALALSSDQLVLVDLDRGAVVFRARIDEGIAGLAGGDVDGDGRDELFVASGKRFARLRCGDCDRPVAEAID